MNFAKLWTNFQTSWTTEREGVVERCTQHWKLFVWYPCSLGHTKMVCRESWRLQEEYSTVNCLAQAARIPFILLLNSITQGFKVPYATRIHIQAYIFHFFTKEMHSDSPLTWSNTPQKSVKKWPKKTGGPTLRGPPVFWPIFTKNIYFFTHCLYQMVKKLSLFVKKGLIGCKTIWTSFWKLENWSKSMN